MRRTGVCEINSHVMGGGPLGAIPPHPQFNVDELCEEWQVLAKKNSHPMYNAWNQAQHNIERGVWGAGL